MLDLTNFRLVDKSPIWYVRDGEIFSNTLHGRSAHAEVFLQFGAFPSRDKAELHRSVGSYADYYTTRCKSGLNVHFYTHSPGPFFSANHVFFRVGLPEAAEQDVDYDAEFYAPKLLLPLRGPTNRTGLSRAFNIHYPAVGSPSDQSGDFSYAIVSPHAGVTARLHPFVAAMGGVVLGGEAGIEGDSHSAALLYANAVAYGAPPPIRAVAISAQVVGAHGCMFHSYAFAILGPIGAGERKHAACDMHSVVPIIFDPGRQNLFASLWAEYTRMPALVVGQFVVTFPSLFTPAALIAHVQSDHSTRLQRSNNGQIGQGTYRMFFRGEWYPLFLNSATLEVMNRRLPDTGSEIAHLQSVQEFANQTLEGLPDNARY